MSTFSGLLVSMTGALAHDVYGRMLRPKATAGATDADVQMVAVLVIIGAVAIGLGSQVEHLSRSTSWSARPSPLLPPATFPCCS